MCVSLMAGLAAAGSAASAAAPFLSGLAAIKALTQRPDRGPDPAQQQAAVDGKAAQSANARLAMRRKALSASALATGGGDLMSTGVLGGGKTTLGGG